MLRRVPPVANARDYFAFGIGTLGKVIVPLQSK